jgi:hypothetical protein
LAVPRWKANFPGGERRKVSAPIDTLKTPLCTMNPQLLQWFRSGNCFRRKLLQDTAQWQDLGRKGFRTGARHHSGKQQRKWRQPHIFYPSCALALGVAGITAYENHTGFRHSVLAVVRCSRIASKSSGLHTTKAGAQTFQMRQFWEP